jgi:hypothetical protein
MLSLDAPTVALVWQWEVARAAGVRLAASRAFILGSSIWMAYVADRWIEGWRLAPQQIRTQRHAFYQRSRWPVAAVWAATLVADVAVSCVALDRRELQAGLLLLVPVSAYLLSHQLVHRHHRWRVPKEACVALLLGGGVALFVVAAPAASFAPAAVPVALFTLLCLANCALISVWEEAVDRDHGQTSLARQFQRGAAFGRALPWLLGAAAAVAAAASRGAPRGAAESAAASCMLLAAVDRIQPRAGWALARVLADLALMTPAIPLARSLLG